MKKLLLITLVICSLSVNAQKKDSTAAKDSVPSLTDTTALVTYKDYNDFVNAVVMDMPAKYADVVRQWWMQRYQQRAGEYLKPKKK
jgi:hypothetical protein